MNEVKIVRRLCETLMAQNESVYETKKLSDLVGVSPERLLVIIVKYQSTMEDKIFNNLFFCDYNPFVKGDGKFIEINLTPFGELVVKQNDGDYWNSIVASLVLTT